MSRLLSNFSCLETAAAKSFPINLALGLRSVENDVSYEIEEDPTGGRIEWEQGNLNGAVLWDCYGKYWGIRYFP
ncbi:hypothetical protein RYX36_013690 [Vicia faba]